MKYFSLSYKPEKYDYQNYYRDFRKANLINQFKRTAFSIVFAVIITITSKKDEDGASEIFGYQIRVVTSDSMAKSEYTNTDDYDIKSIPIRSLVFIDLVPEDKKEADAWYEALDEGDVLTFRYVYTTQVTITHRITAITEKKTGGFVIELAGDNKNVDSGQLIQIIDTSIPYNTNYVIGKVTGQAYLLGVILSFLATPLGIVSVIIVPCFVIILFEVLKIARMFGADKKQREHEEKEKQERELEELRRKIAELEGEKRESTQPQPSSPIDSKEEET